MKRDLERINGMFLLVIWCLHRNNCSCSTSGNNTEFHQKCLNFFYSPFTILFWAVVVVVLLHRSGSFHSGELVTTYRLYSDWLSCLSAWFKIPLHDVKCMIQIVSCRICDMILRYVAMLFANQLVPKLSGSWSNALMEYIHIYTYIYWSQNQRRKCI